MILPVSYNVDISKPLLPTPLQCMLITADEYANQITVHLFSGSTPYSPGGTCAGFAVRKDGATVAITGTVSGNALTITLPPAAYAIEGPINIGVKSIADGSETTVFLGIGSVSMGETGVAVDPGTIIPSVTALIQAIEDATASIPSDYSDLLATLAPTFSTSANYAAGQYVWNSGTLYKFTADHAAGAWIGTDAMLAIVGADLTSVTKNLNAFADGYIHETNTEITNTTSHSGYRYAADGSLVTNTPSIGTSVAVEVPVSGGQIIRWVCYYANRNSTYNVKYLMSDNSVVTDTNYTSSGNEYVFTVPANCVKLLATCWVLDDPGNTFYRVTYSADRLKSIIDNMAEDVDLASEKGTNAMLGITSVFANTVAYNAGDYVWYRGVLYRFTTGHAVGAWTGTDAEEVTIGAEVADLKSAMGTLEPAATSSDVGKALIAKTVSGGKVTEYEFGAAGEGLPSDVKSALLACFAKVAWVDDNGQDYYDALEAALYPPASLVSISAVYTQSGTVYTTDSLDSLKTDLVVTATYDDTTSETVTSYTLSGTLTEGTSTITVSYGGKTTTFTVTVSVWSTLPVIAAADEYYASDGTTGSKTGMSRTALYEYDIDIDALKAHAYYDAENNYMKNAGSVFVIKYYVSNPDSLTGYSVCKHDYFSGNTFVYYGSITPGELKNLSDARYMSAILSNSKLKIGFSLFTAGIADSYAYFDTTVTGIMPEGINAGDIIFAGANTPYYNKHNISEVS